MAKYIIKKILNFLIKKSTFNVTRILFSSLIAIYLIKILTLLVSIFPLFLDQFAFISILSDINIDIVEEQYTLTLNSENNNNQVSDKGKGKAIDYDSYDNTRGNKRPASEDLLSEEERQVKKAKIESLKDSKNDTNQENYAESSYTTKPQDHKLIELSEEDKAMQKALYLSYNTESINYIEDTEGSEYSVYSSEHSNDSDNTKLTKQAIKEIEKTLPKKDS